MEFHIDQASYEDLATVAEISRICFTGIDVIPLSILQSWFSKNPNGFLLVRDGLGEIVGNYTVLPLEKTTLESFRVGSITEREIPSNGIKSPADKNTRDLYVESISITMPPGIARSKALKAALLSLPETLSNVSSCGEGDLYAIQVSLPGKQLLKRMGFEVDSAGLHRNDNHDLYKLCFKKINKFVLNIT